MKKLRSFLNHLTNEIDTIYKADALNATILMLYISIDTLAFLSMPTNQNEVNRKNFINWVNKYLGTSSEQAYQYCGKDFYSSRCGKIHSYTPYSSYGKKENCKIFGFHVGENHEFQPKINPNMVLISIPRLVKDFKSAVSKYEDEISESSNLKKRIESRIDSVYQVFIPG